MDPTAPAIQDLEDRLAATTGQLSQALTALIATQAQNLALIRQANRLQEMLAKVNAAQKSGEPDPELPLPSTMATGISNGVAATH